MVLTLGVGCYHHILALGFFLRPSFGDVVHTVHASKLIKEQCHLWTARVREKTKNYEKAKFFISIADAVYHVTTGIGNAEFGESTNW